MSWGVFVSFSLELTDAQWKQLSAQTSNEAGHGSSWETWPTTESTWYFTPKRFGDAPIEALLTEAVWEDDELENVGLSVEKANGRVEHTLFAFLDRAADQIHEVGCLARALVGACRLGGSGSLVISSDGSAPPGVGWRCTVSSVSNDVLVTTPLDRAETKTLREQACARLGIGED